MLYIRTCVSVTTQYSSFSQDKNSIVMTIDMHLTLPTGIVEYARRVSSKYVRGS